jgi:hypothetical protein
VTFGAPAGRPTETPSRVEVTREAGTLRIVSRAPRSAIAAIFLGAWLAGWALGWRTALGALLEGGEPLGVRAFLVLWLLLWTLAGLFVLWSIAWSVAGREEISVEPRGLAIRRAALGVGWTRRYDFGAMEALETVPAPGGGANEDGPGGSRLPRTGSIQFRHMGKRVRFGQGLAEPDVERILAELRGRLPARAKGGWSGGASKAP